MSELTISGVSVRQDEKGRFCLNDLHRAAGEEKRHQPSDWLRIQQTQELINEVEIPGIPGIVSKQGLGLELLWLKSLFMPIRCGLVQNSICR